VKPGLATFLSLVGVLATGGAALALNSSILDTESSTKGSPASATVVGIRTQSGVTSLGDGATSGSVTEFSAEGLADAINGSPETPLGSPLVDIVESEAEGSYTTPTEPLSTDAPDAPSRLVEKQFKIADIATVTLKVVDGLLIVKDVAIAPDSTYQATDHRTNIDGEIRITLASPSSAVEFSARLVNGQIMAAVSTPSSGHVNPPRSRREDDDDDDDDDDGDGPGHHERENHERDHDDDD